MPYPTLSVATEALKHSVIAPHERERREKELRRVRDKAIKGFRKRLNDDLAKAREGYEVVVREQDELARELKAVVKAEGHMSPAEFSAAVSELRSRASGFESRRDRHRRMLVGVGEKIELLEDDPDAFIDDFYRRHSALSHPAQSLGW